MDKPCGVSVVVPFYNEEDGVAIFCRTLDEFAKKNEFPIELVFVDDGSTDDSIKQLRLFKFQNINEITIIQFTRNFGSQAAIRAGISKAKYHLCTWISVDLQEPLELIPKSYSKIVSGDLDIVYIVKDEIDVNYISRFFSKRYYSLMRKYAIRNYPSGGIGAVFFSKKVKDYLNKNVEINSTIVLQLLNAGFRYELMPMRFSAREIGRSKWTFSKKIKTFIDSFVSFSYMPIRMVSIIGIIMFFIGCVIAVFTVINKFTRPLVPIGYSTIISILALGFGITNISLGIVAEYLWRTFDVSRRQAPFIISDEIEIVKDETGTGT